MENKKCQVCEKALVKIGNDRKNGKRANDWDERTLHKKCWNKQQQAYRAMQLMKRYGGNYEITQLIKRSDSNHEKERFIKRYGGDRDIL
jgi:hypothetical protein